MKHAAIGFLLALCLLLRNTLMTVQMNVSREANQPEGLRVCRADLLEREQDLSEQAQSDEPLPPMWHTDKTLDCSREGIDAATTFRNGKTFFFKDYFYWRLINSDVSPGYPRLISQDWDGLPGNLDAALTWKDGRTFFFKGTQYWSFHGKRMDSDYPRNIGEGFCGIPDNIDAALLWKPNNKAYFFKGDMYWRFDGVDASEPVSKDYPMSIRDGWKGIPTNLDAAMQWSNGRSYFFKGEYYYRYNDYGNDSDARPILIDKNWGLKCSDLNDRILQVGEPGFSFFSPSPTPTPCGDFCNNE